MAAAARRVGGAFFRVGQKFTNYLKMVADDYATVFKQTVGDAKEQKVKAGTSLAVTGVLAYAFARNADREHFLDALSVERQKLALLSDDIRNPLSTKHVEDVTLLLNQDQLSFYNCLFGMVILKSEFPPKSGLYEANCKNIRPRWRDFPQRIVDIGAFGRFWYLRNAMQNYDVNENEWKSDDISAKFGFV